MLSYCLGIVKEENDKVRESLEEVKKNVIKLTNVIKGSEELGYAVPPGILN